ncbi:MAG: hypothetical protein JWP55_2022 [Mycobacterium sp.]|jgi:hypothetical protein|nr:hypothetical protein [Mycobacterium sp.]
MKFAPIATVAVGVAATAILVAPIASAERAGESCGGTGGGTTCQSAGNVQINDAPGPVQFFPYGGEAFLLGGGGLGGGGGAH